MATNTGTAPSGGIADAIAAVLGKVGGQKTHALGVRDNSNTGGGMWITGPDGKPEWITGVGTGVHGKTAGGTATGSPIYHQGDENIYGSRSPEQIAQLQQQLVDAGLLDPRSVTWSVPDAATTAAMKALLEESNRNGATWDVVLQQRLDLAKQGLIGHKAGRQTPPNTITLANPADIKKTVGDTALNLLGRKLSDDELSPFIQRYHDIQSAAQTQAYNQQYTATGYGSGGTTTQEPTLAAFAEDQMNKNYKTEVQGNQLGQNAMYYLKLLGQGAGPGGLSQAQS